MTARSPPKSAHTRSSSARGAPAGDGVLALAVIAEFGRLENGVAGQDLERPREPLDPVNDLEAGTGDAVGREKSLLALAVLTGRDGARTGHQRQAFLDGFEQLTGYVLEFHGSHVDPLDEPLQRRCRIEGVLQDEVGDVGGARGVSTRPLDDAVTHAPSVEAEHAPELTAAENADP